MQPDKRSPQILEIVRAAHFPVYGLIGSPLDLVLCSHGRGSFGELNQPMSVTFNYTSPRYPEKGDNFEITSIDAAVQHQSHTHIAFDLKDPSAGSLFDFDTETFRRHCFSAEEHQRAGLPLVWEGALSIANMVFLAKIRYWSQPFMLALFLLKSEGTVLLGNACGLSYQELIRLLKNMEVINHREDLLRQYQQEFQRWRKHTLGK